MGALSIQLTAQKIMQIAEIKCPYAGKESKLWKLMEKGEIPKYYLVQMEQQMFVSGAQFCHFFVYASSDGSFLHQVVEPDLELRQNLIEAWKEFWPTYQPYLESEEND